MEPSASPREISFPLPKNADYILHMHLTFLETSLILFLTTTKRDESGSTLAAMGSFVYAMPDRTNASNVISTPLFTSTSSIEYASRTAKILARKMQIPVYVGCSLSLVGNTVEEEMEGLRKVVEVVMDEWRKR